MSRLVLIRHAQASFFQADYDQLSAVGEDQAVQLGLHCLRHGILFDEIYTGPRVRQIRTAEIARDVVCAEGFCWPEPVVLDELDEHQAQRILANSAAAVRAGHPHVQVLVEEFERAQGEADRYRTFQRMFEAVASLWSAGKVELADVEPWKAFQQRVRRGVGRMTNSQARGRRVAAFTSGGPIAMVAQIALACPDTAALELSWRIRNASLTEFVFTKDRFTLDAFNRLPHLEDPSLWTFR